jgi:hypothetical protein
MVDKSAGAMSSRMGRVGAAMSSMGNKMMIGVTLPIIGFMGVALKAAGDAEKATQELNSALKRAGTYSSEASRSLAQYAESLMKVTIYDDEMIRSTMAQGINMGVTTGKIKEATKAAIGLADKYGMDLNTSMRMVALAGAGFTIMLKRKGIILDETMTKEEKFNELLRLGTEGFKTSTEKAKTAEGQMLQLRNAFGELAEKIGRKLLPILKKITPALIGVLDCIGKLSTSTILWGMGIAVLVPPLLRVIGLFAELRAAALLAGAASAIAGGAGAAGGLASRVPGIAALLAGPSLAARAGVALPVVAGAALGVVSGMQGMKRAREDQGMGWNPLSYPGYGVEKWGNAVMERWGSTTPGRTLQEQGRAAKGEIRAEQEAITKQQGDEIIKKLGDIARKTGTWG